MGLRGLISAASSLTGSSGGGFPPRTAFDCVPQGRLAPPARRPTLFLCSCFVPPVLYDPTCATKPSDRATTRACT
jgi:hypothetical protein